jgi:hypothetical protein
LFAADQCFFIAKFFITKLTETNEGRRSADRRNVLALSARRAGRRCRLPTLRGALVYRRSATALAAAN